jgi:pyridoxine 5'-phosphate synthase PdxJ
LKRAAIFSRPGGTRLQYRQTPGVQTPGYFQNVPAGHSRAPFQRCAMGVGLEKAVREMLRLMKNYRG